jgi:hypothetical protein
MTNKLLFISLSPFYSCIPYPGNDILALKNTDTETCKSLCAQKPECVAAISWKNGDCFLKRRFGKKSIGGARTVYRKVVTAADTCNDQNASCADWATVGECAKNPSFMLTVCAKSCQAQGYTVNCAAINSKSTAELVMATKSVDEKSLVVVPLVTRIEAKWGDLLSGNSNPDVVAKGSSVSIAVSNNDSGFVVADSTNAAALQAISECNLTAAAEAGAVGSSGEGSYLVELSSVGQYTFSSANVDECLAGMKFQITSADNTESISFGASVSAPGVDQQTIILSAVGGSVFLIMVVAAVIVSRGRKASPSMPSRV